MAKPNGLVKVSGNLLGKSAVLNYIAELANKYSLAVLIGGGAQINEAFKKKGWENEFTPMGRVTETLEKRQLARDTLEVDQANVQDMLDYLDIGARIIIPVMDVATVLCHVNGDVFVLAAYNGFDKIFILTTQDRVEAKRE